MRKIVFILISLCFLNAEARQCGSFKEMRGHVKKVLKQRQESNSANYMGDSESIQINFEEEGEIVVGGGVCRPKGNVCVNFYKNLEKSVDMDIACEGGTYTNIGLTITQMRGNEVKVKGTVSFFSKEYLLKPISLRTNNSLFSMNVAPVKNEHEMEQFLRDLKKAKRNQRIEQFKRSRHLQPSRIETPQGFSNSIDI